MMLRSVESDDIDVVFGWLTDECNSKWLDFGHGRPLQTLALKLMLREDWYVLRLFVPSDGQAPVGIVGLSDVNRRHRTAMLWYVLGVRAHGGRGYTTQAVSRLLADAFGELELGAISAWTVESNVASRRVLERNGFQLIGSQRQCHWLDGRMVDRLWFDLLSREFRGVL